MLVYCPYCVIAQEKNDKSHFDLGKVCKTLEQLKNEYWKGLDIELTFQINDSLPGKKRICINKLYELNYSIIKNDEEYVDVINPDYAFSLKRKNAQSKWELKNMNDAPKEAREHQQFTHGLLPTSELAFGGLFLDSGWIDKLLLSDSFEVLSIQPKQSENIEIKFRSQHNMDKDNKIIGGSLVFNPKNCWLVDECDVNVEFLLISPKNPEKKIFNKYSIRTHFEYNNIDGYPFPKKITTIYNSSTRPPIKQIVEYTSIKRSMPSKDIFYMSHYGFPEPSHPMRRGDVIRIILITVGTIMILVSLFMRFLAKRMK
jgi:hypothetical protein